MTRTMLRIATATFALLWHHTDVAADDAGPVFRELPSIKANPNPSVPLAAIVKFEAAEFARTEIEVSDGDNTWKFHFDGSREPDEGLPIVGFRPQRTHQITVSIIDNNGRRATADPRTFRTPTLPSEPAEFPDINVVSSEAELCEPGLRLFNPRRRLPRNTQAGNAKEREFGESFGMLLMVDAAGSPVWYYKTDSRIAGFSMLDNGHIIYVTAASEIVEIDLLGNVINSWYASRRPRGSSTAIPIDALTFHHDMERLENGNVLALSSEQRKIENYFTSEYNKNAPRRDQWVMGDRVVEFTPSGEIA